VSLAKSVQIKTKRLKAPSRVCRKYAENWGGTVMINALRMMRRIKRKSQQLIVPKKK
jgi:hypothetical protein